MCIPGGELGIPGGAYCTALAAMEPRAQKLLYLVLNLRSTLEAIHTVQLTPIDARVGRQCLAIGIMNALEILPSDALITGLLTIKYTIHASRWVPLNKDGNIREPGVFCG